MVVTTMIDDVTETVTTGYRHCKAIYYRVVAVGFDGSVELSSELSSQPPSFFFGPTPDYGASLVTKPFAHSPHRHES